MTTRRRFTGEFKARVALEALRGDKTVQEIASKHKVHREGESDCGRARPNTAPAEKRPRRVQFGGAKEDFGERQLKNITMPVRVYLVRSAPSLPSATSQPHASATRTTLSCRRKPA